MTRPVLVTGSHRSGSTWIGRMLASADELHYVQEPFNIVARQRWLSPRPPRQFLYICDDNEAPWVAPMQRVVDLRYPLLDHLRTIPPWRVARRAAGIAWRARQARQRGCAALIKDPIAVFSAPWMVDRFDVQPVFVIRDPVAFVGSLKARDWAFDFRHWFDQPELVSNLLSPWADEIRSMVERPADIVEQGILEWNAIYGFVDAYRRARPSTIVVDYETIASNPEVEVEALFARLGLAFGDVQRATVAELSTGEGGDGSSAIDVRRDSAAALATWTTRLSDDEVERIRRGTAVVRAEFATREEW